ncbi:MAG: ATP synthase F1 subunit delta [Alphaproteobacteria bacterium]
MKEIVKRYAKAFFSIAEKENITNIEQDLKILQDLSKDNSSFNKLISLRNLKSKTQIILLDNILKTKQFSNTTKNFCFFLVKNKRLYALPYIIEEFFNLLADKKGEMKAEVTSAEKLTAQQVMSITTSLEALYKKKINLNLIIDEEILGGLIIKINSKMLDNSFRSQLQKLKNVTREAIFQN